MPLHLQIADTTILNIYAELVVRWPYGLQCTMVITVGSQERATQLLGYIASQWDRYLVPQNAFLVCTINLG